MIHPTAIVSPSAIIGNNVKIGPYCVIGDDVVLSDDVELVSHVSVDGMVKIGEGTKIFPFASIGHAPQDLKYKGEKSCIIIGKNNAIREYVTIHPGTETGIMKTVIGDGNLFMIGVHIAHDCIVGSNIVMGNNATLGGHVNVGDNVIIGGLVAVHQFVRIGRNAIIGGFSGVEHDVIPYGAVKGERAHLYNLNLIGLRRAGVSNKEISFLQKAYSVLFSEQDVISDNLDRIEKEYGSIECVSELLAFVREKSNRSLCLPRICKC